MSQCVEVGTLEWLTRQGALTAARTHRRKTVELTLTQDSESNFYMGLTNDVSKAGLFVATHVIHPVGSEIYLALHMAPFERTVCARGVVRWVRDPSDPCDAPAGMGLQLDLFNADDLALIDFFVSNRDPIFFESE